MTVPYRKKLIEVALPLEAINAASAREKSIRHGHPSTLHLWWARRPLAACRAVLFASLVDDPSSDPSFGGDEEIEATKRAELFNLIEELVQWQNSNNPRVINKARAEIARCIASRKIETRELKKNEAVSLPKGEGDKAKKYTPQDITRMLAPPEAVNHFLANYGPPVLDPFCGGGSIPLEAQRLGLRAYASDLNPVAVLITKALIEIPPKFAGMPPVNPDWQKKSREEKAATVWEGAQGLAEDVRYYGKWMRDEAERRIGHLYPKIKVTKKMAKDRPDLKPYVGDEFMIDAWLWARAFQCANPRCGKIVPMVTSAIVSERPLAYLKPVVRDDKCLFDIAHHATTFNGTQTGRGAKFACPFCHMVSTDEIVRAAAQSGEMESTLTSVVCSRGKTAIFLGSVHAKAINREDPELSSVLDQEVSREHRCVLYGLRQFRSLFSTRQLRALLTFSDLVEAARLHTISDSRAQRSDGTTVDYADAVALYLAFMVDRAADYWSQMVTWMPRGTVRQTFARQRIAMNWDWAETNPFGAMNCAWDEGISWVAKVIERLPHDSPKGNVSQLSAKADRGLKSAVIATDPPYYDNIPYADCSDYFYVWLRNSIRNRRGEYAGLLNTLLTPKSEELVANAGRHDGDRKVAKDFFEKGLGTAFEK